MKITLNCAYCKKQFQLPRYLYNKRIKRNNNSNIYCSKKCSCKSRITKQKFECYNCGKVFYKIPSIKSKSKSGHLFCSKSCSNSYNNTFRYKVSINTYRRIAFENFEHKCKICGWDKDERILEVHHIDENRKNNELNNLIILCPICHRYLTLHLKTLEDFLK